MKIAHIINVAEIKESQMASYLHIAQPLTMKSMIFAKRKAKGEASVDLIAIKHKAEKVTIPSEFQLAADLETYAWEHIENLKSEPSHKPLPRLTDILTSLYSASSAEYFVFTNADIGLYPEFYIFVKQIIEQGFDAFCINRRELPKKYADHLLDENNLDLIYSIEGTRHGGIDCFVFKREIVPHLNLGNVYIGYPPVGLLLKTQISNLSRNFTWFKDEKLTFHIGSDRSWKGEGESYKNYDQNKYWLENVEQSKLVGLHYPKSSNLATSSKVK